MAVGSHRDAFNAHQLVRKLAKDKTDPALARLAADILLRFVENHRQVRSEYVIDHLPTDHTRYEEDPLDSALCAVGALCGQCAEDHHDACFINQVRRILIAAKTRVDPGSAFDGRKTLEMLLNEARWLAERLASAPDGDKSATVCPLPQDQDEEDYATLKEKYEQLREKDIFRGTLISEIVKTIRSVSEGNFEAEMPVHDDPQLGQLATAFNLMLRTVKDAMSHLDLLVADRTGDLHMLNTELQESLEETEAINRKIMDSISYARIIQTSLLADSDRVSAYLPDSFFLWMPRDMVGGDIFYTDSFGDQFVVAVVDCTGHGVPGAFMTMIAASGLRRIVRDDGCHDPGEILKRLNFIVKTSLHQDTDHALSDDGLDAGICFADKGSGELRFAGARISLFHTCDGQIGEIRGNRHSIGYRRSDLSYTFTGHTLPLRENMTFYMATDGFTDQLGGKKELRFGKKRLRKLMALNWNQPVEKQRDIFLNTFNTYKGDREMQDDVTVVGFRV
ncbi:hypothetical protein DENIS_1987 [Desulfonema ishimotonii]|uniref:HAMP domain-containing protein n=1 Tax=Desulfonema ishimotonii TaxID=45657 RepID=A0A401FVM0_9BACT|nr:SpoIIE family protein phosphatase [Desulfonema ishimotonii]GBC61027.1 hypothetical protein DENIS_1987 [Desulfonema ishimotonii]